MSILTELKNYLQANLSTTTIANNWVYAQNQFPCICLWQVAEEEQLANEMPFLKKLTVQLDCLSKDSFEETDTLAASAEQLMKTHPDFKSKSDQAQLYEKETQTYCTLMKFELVKYIGSTEGE